MTDSLRAQAALELLHIPSRPSQTWEEREYHAVLSHFLSSSVRETLSTLDPMLLDQFERVVKHDCDPGVRFDRLLDEEDPAPLSLLRLVKETGKICLVRTDLGVPGQVAEVIYYLAVASAFVHRRAWITTLIHGAVEDGLRQILSHRWLEPRVRSLFERFLERLTSGERRSE